MTATWAAEIRRRLATGVTMSKGEGSTQPPGMGGEAPLVERFEATPPLRRPDSSEKCGMVVTVMRIQRPALPRHFFDL